MSVVVKVGDNVANCGTGILYRDAKPEAREKAWQWLRRFVKEGLGNFVTVSVCQDPDLMRQIIRYLTAHRTYFSFTSIREHGGRFQLGSKWRKLKRTEFFTSREFAELLKLAGPYYVGRWALTEAAGMLYWPRTYLIGRREHEYEPLPQVSDLVSAKQAYVRLLKRVLRKERAGSPRKLYSVDGSMAFKYAAEAGFRILALEAMAGSPHRMYAAMRGAAVAYGIEELIGYVAYMWYSGFGYDATWLKRWKISLNYAFLQGATVITGESPMYGGLAFVRDGNHPAAVGYRSILKEFHEFCQTHPRPRGKPKATLGVVYGNLDGCPGLWNPWVWGQYRHDKWRNGPAEESWELADGLVRKEEWLNTHHVGDRDFSGNPPYGQYDVVPIEADEKILKRYKCLIFLGWNTMTPAIYRKLKRYVQAGGHLVMSVPHLSTQIDRADDLKIIRRGNVQDVFGVRIKRESRRRAEGIKFFTDSCLKTYRFPNWGRHVDPKFLNAGIPLAEVELCGAQVLATTGQAFDHNLDDKDTPPVLVENRCGRGVAILLLSWAYPGDRRCRDLAREIVRVANIGEQGRIRLAGPAGLRYAVYAEKGGETIYLLNTEMDIPLRGLLFIDDLQFTLTVPEAEMRIVTHRGGVALSPVNSPAVHIASLRRHGNTFRAVVRSAGRQEIEIAVRGPLKAATWNGKRIPVRRRGNDRFAVTVEGGKRAGVLSATIG